jgi:hypothetical protein
MENVEKIPENFHSIVEDFTTDLSLTFPEYSNLWSKWCDKDLPEELKKELFNYCVTVYPERFFDILYQNDEIFNKDSVTNTFFLPDVDFKLLFHCEGLSDNTKKTMWKYLQLILFTIISGVKDKNSFGETMNLFDGIEEKDLQEKLNETMCNLTDFFQNVVEEDEEEEKGKAQSSEEGEERPNFEKMFEKMPGAEEFKKAFSSGKMDGIPNMENIHDHIKTLFNGKIGSLAKEMAEEISGEFADLLGEDMGNSTDTNDILKKLMKNPKKIMDLMKTVSSKLDNKMRSGEFSREDIMKEASDLIGKMKDMGGSEQFNEMFKNLTKSMGGMGKNMKMDTNALNRMTKQQTTRERLLKKMELKKQEELKNQMRMQQNVSVNAETNNLVFRMPDVGSQEKSYIHPDILAEMEADLEKQKENPNSNTQKKNKKKKSKK